MSECPTSVASISCLCEKVSVQQIVVAPLGSRPPPRSPGVSLCHCSVCRSTSGVLCTSYCRLLLTPDSNASSLIFNPSLKEYVQSPQLSRWFCGTCGAHVLAHLKHGNKYFVAAGLVSPASSESSSVTVPNETELVAEHWGVGETRDGGISVFIPGTRNDSTSCLLASTTETTDPSSPPLSSALSTSTSALAVTGVVQEGQLRAQCQCGGVVFVITPPNSRSREASSPWSDVLVPYHLASSSNPSDVKWWLRANDTKYMAATCACRSCRLASGFPIQCWAFIPKVNLINETNQASNNTAAPAVDEFSYDVGTMQRFESSPGVYREFCKSCGATVFWHCDERPGVVDVSVGLLKSPTGARAEDLLEWETGRVSFAEDAAQHQSLIALLERGLRNPVY